MIEEWRSLPLSEVCHFLNGLWKGESPPFLRVGVIRNTNFTKEGELDDSDIAYLDVEARKFQSRRLQFGDIILEKSGGGPKQPVGRVVLFDKVEGNYSFSNFTSAIRVKDTSLLYHRYLHKYLHWLYLCGRTESMQSHSTGIRNLNGNAYKAIEIALPPFSEQKRIVAILDEVLDGISLAMSNAEKNLVNSRDLFENYLDLVFTKKGDDWVTEQLGAIAKFIDYRGKTPPKRESGVRLITAKNVKMGYIQRNPEEFIDPAAYDGWMTRGFPKKGDVLFTTEAPLGNVAQLDTDETVVIGQRLITLQPDDDRLDRTFLKFALMSSPVQREILAQGTGATVVGIKAKLLKQIPIYFPKEFSHQIAVAANIERISDFSRSLENNYRQKIFGLIELKHSIMQQAFSGNLTSRSSHPSQEAAE